MIVTFISQCKKNALKRTRRVLDAFANRIGDCVWQTVITEDGLIAVKKLLRQTATKNTAVACHWIRSRNRSELVWIVGSESQFNVSGIVPVNITQKELFTDEDFMKPQSILYANTHRQPLNEHLFAVGYVAELLIKSLMPEKKALADAVFIAGCLHDLGKIDSHFQAWVTNPKKRECIAEDGQHIDEKKFSFEKHPRHNELSLLLYNFLDQPENKVINSPNKQAIEHCIYWHHAKPFRKDKDYKSLNDIYANFCNNDSDWQGFIGSVVKHIREVSEIDLKYRNSELSFLTKFIPNDLTLDNDKLGALNKFLLPEYKTYSNQIENVKAYLVDIEKNATKNVMRAALVTADRLISSLDAKVLSNHIVHRTLEEIVQEKLKNESNLSEHVQQCVNYFNYKFQNSERNQKQNSTAIQLQNVSDIAVLAGAAGCGKTKIALEWAKLKNANKIIWICPRVQVCQGIFNELISEDYLPNAQIEINTGEFKFTNSWENLTPEEKYFSGDVVITTIDQVLSNITTHNNVTGLIDYLNTHVVFDEYHEYISMPAFNLLFAELVQCKKERGKDANTLLVSATPNYYFVKNVLNIQHYNIIEMTSFNQSEYKIDFVQYDETIEDESNPLYQAQLNNTFIISNTAITAQKSFIRNQREENAVLIHSKYKKSDKKYWFNEVFESFKNEGTRKFEVLRSGPIVQASLNISCDYMITELTNAENCLQRLGRLDRFGTNTNVNVLKIVVPESIDKGKGNGATARFLSRMNIFDSTRAWYEFLRTKTDASFKLPQIYQWYADFYGLENNINRIESDLLGALKKSVNLIQNKVIDPITFPSQKIKEKGTAKISKNSLRGENRFVQMAVCKVNAQNQPDYVEEYAYSYIENESVDNLTASIDEIKGFEDSNKNLLAHMVKKHHNIIDGAKKPHKDAHLLVLARSPEFPIYLSYTSEDLAKVGGEHDRHPEAIYYVVTNKQPVGSMSIKHLLTSKEE
jgi:CRISPR-associated endonuclease/helicase Cas3